MLDTALGFFSSWLRPAYLVALDDTGEQLRRLDFLQTAGHEDSDERNAVQVRSVPDQFVGFEVRLVSLFDFKVRYFCHAVSRCVEPA